MTSRTFTFNSAHVAERKVRNEYVLIPVSSQYGQNGTLFDLNPMAAAIWERAKSGISEADIVTEIERTYTVEPEEVAADVKTVLDELIIFGALLEQD